MCYNAGAFGLTDIAIIGAGIGGMALAIALEQRGVRVTIYEQAARFGRVGAAINLTPNAVRVIDGLGLGEAVRASGGRPTFRVNRHWQSGAEISRYPMGREAEERYGVPQLTLHRADLLAALESAVAPSTVRFAKRLRSLRQDADGVVLLFEDGTKARAEAVVGADGIHSVVRAMLFGEDAPQATGVTAYRSFAPVDALTGHDLATFTKWWGPSYDSQIVTFPIADGSELFVFATEAEESAQTESWSATSDVETMKRNFRGYHPEAIQILSACVRVLRTPLYVRDPLPCWSVGRVTLLGDACHPMMPFMAQGAAMSLEDAAVLSSRLADAEAIDIPQSLRAYESIRRLRTAAMQIGSRENKVLPDGVKADWVYAYDAWREAATIP